MLNRIKQIQNLLLEALEIKDPGRQSAFLAEACGSDTALQEELEELIQSEAAAGQSLPGEPYVAASRATLRRAVEALTDLPRSPSPLLNEKPGDRIGRYKLLQKLGEGGCGVVYVAEQEHPVRRQVALKVIKLGMDTREVVARFEAERQALALMDHSNIAKVFDAGATEAGRPFFVMELVQGVRITDYCTKNVLATRARLELFIKVCQAIQHAHQKGVIHRDIKPSNVLVTVVDGIAVPKVIDFGIAKATEGRLTGLTMATAFEQFLGTPAYMSPEQAALASGDVDTRSDIYSLGVLLYELLTGSTPFDTKALLASGLDELRRTIREKEPMRPSMRLSAKITTLAMEPTNGIGGPPEAQNAKAANAFSSRRLGETKALVKVVRGDLDWIVMKCLEKDRARRYETASGLAKDIERHLNNEPVVARPPSRMYEFHKTVRRHKLVFAAAAAVILTLSAGILVSTWQAVQKNRERQHLKENVIGQYVANGARLVSEGDLFGSLLWYAEALRLDAGDPAREQPHRIRIASVLRQCPRLVTVISHGNVVHAEFSPDGSKVLTASDDHTARVWDATTGQQLLALPHDGEVYDARYSKNGLRIITASRDGTANIWDSRTGNLLRSLKHPAMVWQARLSPDGTLAATACLDTSVRIWDVATGALAAEPLKHKGFVGQVAFSPDGRLLATLSGETAYLWDLPAGRLQFQSRDTANWANDLDVAFSPDGQSFATCEDSKLHIWDSHTFKERGVPALVLPGVEEIAFSPSGNVIVAGGDSAAAQVWDAHTGQPRFLLPVQHTGILTTARISPDGRSFVTGGNDAVTRTWSTSTGQPLAPPLKTIVHSRYVSFNPDGRRLLVKSCDQAVRVWDMATSDSPGPSCPSLPGGNRVVSPDGRYALLNGGSNNVWITDTRSGTRLATLPHTNEVIYCCFSGDGRTVLTAAEKQGWVAEFGNDIFLWDRQSGRRLNSNSMSQGFSLMYAAFSPDNRRLLTCGFDFSARLWDAQTGQPLSGLMRHGQPVIWGTFSPDGSSVVTVSRDKTARVWDAATGSPLTPPLQHKSAISGAFWSADLERLETVTVDDYLQIWDLPSGLPLTPPRKIRVIGEDPAQAVPAAFAHQDEELPRDDRPVEDLVLLSRMLAVGRIDAAGNAVPLTLPELTKAWQVLRGKYPEQFATTGSEVVAWHRQEAEESEKEGNLTAALFHLDRALAAQPVEPVMTRWRGEVAAGLAQGTNHASLPVTNSPRFAARDPRAGAQQIDLSPHYNLELHRPGGNDFGNLREGLQTFGGVQFDVCGCIHLNGQTDKQEGSDLPERVEGIRVGQKCRRLHFLQGTSWDAETGVEIGSYVLHYADGQRRKLPIVYGWDTENWWIDGLPSANLFGGALPVWNGTNRKAAENGSSLLLYKNTRENPRPDVEVTSIDFVSHMTAAAPFLVALTVE